MNRVKDKICLVSGAAQGIGLAACEALLKEGAIVILTDILDDLGNQMTTKLGPKAFYHHLDVIREEDWVRAFQWIEEKFGRLDVLVNNAGITGQQSGLGPTDPENMSVEAWDRVHLVNSDGVFLGCKHGIKLMKKHKSGSIINVSSRSGIVGVPGSAAYASSKASVRNHTKSVALYCAQKGYSIRCNSIHPAAILTPLWEPFLGSGPAREQNLKMMTSQIPLKRLGTPEEVAQTIVFLASDECTYMTGSEIIIDGGILAGSAASPQAPQHDFKATGSN